MFTFIAHKNHIFFLHISQIYITFALDFEKKQLLLLNPDVAHITFLARFGKRNRKSGICQKGNLTMKMKVTTLKQQTQDLFLRLFVESSSGIGTTPARSNYTCAHCGTYARMRQ